MLPLFLKPPSVNCAALPGQTRALLNAAGPAAPLVAAPPPACPTHPAGQTGLQQKNLASCQDTGLRVITHPRGCRPDDGIDVVTQIRSVDEIRRPPSLPVEESSERSWLSLGRCRRLQQTPPRQNNGARRVHARSCACHPCHRCCLPSWPSSRATAGKPAIAG